MRVHTGGMSDRPLTHLEVADLADSLRRLLAVVEDGDMTASPGMVHRLEGALTALQAVLGPMNETLKRP